MSDYPIIVCDDDNDLAKQLAQKINYSIQNLCDDNSSYGELKEKVSFIANDFAQVAGYIVANDVKNGIYFLDIELSQQSEAKNGVDLAEFIKKQDKYAQIIFVTAYDKYAPLTYRRRIGAIDYINKNMPTNKIIERLEETLHEAFDTLANLIKNGNREFEYRLGRNLFRINESEVMFIETSTMQHKVHLVTAHGDAEFRGNISRIAQETDFLTKVSQSTLVNPENIESIDTANRILVFNNDKQIPYSRAYKRVVNEMIQKQKSIKTFV